jgi:superfamily II DNA/RNA helicase
VCRPFLCSIKPDGSPLCPASIQDVDSGEDVDFSSLLLSAPVAEGLRRAGFKKPSPIQLKAIPLAKLGFGMASD